MLCGDSRPRLSAERKLGFFSRLDVPKQKWRKAQRLAPLISLYTFRISNWPYSTGKLLKNISALK
jgi:hypothetical protein